MYLTPEDSILRTHLATLSMRFLTRNGSDANPGESCKPITGQLFVPMLEDDNDDDDGDLMDENDSDSLTPPNVRPRGGGTVFRFPAAASDGLILKQNNVSASIAPSVTYLSLAGNDSSNLSQDTYPTSEAVDGVLETFPGMMLSDNEGDEEFVLRLPARPSTSSGRLRPRSN